MIILSIETSCDETSISLLKNKSVLSICTLSQIPSHKKYNGVVPGLAAKLHVNNIHNVFISCLEKSKIFLNEIDVISYTEKPGMIICLQIGKIFAQSISLYLKKPILPCNHIHGHIFSTLLDRKKNETWSFPSLSLIISGGHTQMYYLKNFWEIELIGETLDDAVGEFIDKTSSMLGYGYPGGPIIEKLAKKRSVDLLKLPFPLNDKSFNFSFSGLKSEVYKMIEMRKKKLCFFDDSDIAYSIQLIVSKIFVKKISNYIFFSKEIKSLIIGGGVISNLFFRKYIINEINNFIKKKNLPPIAFFFPKKKYSTDNAAMIGLLAYYRFEREKTQKDNE